MRKCRIFDSMRRLLRILLFWMDLADQAFWETSTDWLYLKCPGCSGNLIAKDSRVRTTFIYSTRVTEYQCPHCRQRHLFQTEEYAGKEPIPFHLTDKDKLKKIYDRRYDRSGKVKIAN